MKKSIISNLSPLNGKTDMPNWVYVIKKLLAFVLCFILGVVAANGIVILLLVISGKNFTEGETFSDTLMTFIQFYGNIVFIAVVLLYWKLIEKKPFAKLGVTKRFGNFFVGAVAGVLLLAVCIAGVMLAGGIRFSGVSEKHDLAMIALMFGGFIVQSAMEEFLCRGLVFSSLKEKTSLPVAVSVSTVVFIVPHLSNLLAGSTALKVTALLNLILISVIFSMIMLYFDSIWAACGLHAFWNAFLSCVVGLNVSGVESGENTLLTFTSAGESVLNGGEYGIEASVVTTAVLAAGAVLAVFMVRRRKAEN